MPWKKGSGSKPKRILVVDDEPLVCDVLQRFLQQEPPLLVDTAENGHQALEKATTTKYDLVITDFLMPGIKGDELAQVLKQQNASLNVVLLTAMPLVEKPSAVDWLINKSVPLPHLRLLLAPYLDDSPPPQD